MKLFGPAAQFVACYRVGAGVNSRAIGSFDLRGARHHASHVHTDNARACGCSHGWCTGPIRRGRPQRLARRPTWRARHGLGQRRERENHRGAREGRALRGALSRRAGGRASERPHSVRALPRRRAIQLLARQRARARDLAPHVARELSHGAAAVDHRARRRFAGARREGELGLARRRLQSRRASLHDLALRRWRGRDDGARVRHRHACVREGRLRVDEGQAAILVDGAGHAARLARVESGRAHRVRLSIYRQARRARAAAHERGRDLSRRRGGRRLRSRATDARRRHRPSRRDHRSTADHVRIREVHRHAERA